MTVDEYLQNGGQITVIQAEKPKIHIGSASARLLRALERGAKSVKDLVSTAFNSEKELRYAIKKVREKGFAVAHRNGFVALDDAEIPQIEVEVNYEQKKLTEANMLSLIGKHFLKGKNLLVVNNVYFTGHECDLLCVNKSMKAIEFEIKVSRRDFIADAKKAKWQKPPSAWKHYYVMPQSIYSDDMLELLPCQKSGILLIGDGYVRPSINYKKRAEPHDVGAINQATLLELTRLATARLWRE